MPTHARDRLVEAAEALFYAEGIRAVGIERLLGASGVGRASFYRHFASKDDLVVAVLRGYDQRFRAWLSEATRGAGTDALAVFDALAQRFAAAEFRGCASINTMVEISDPDDPAHRVAAEHKQAVIADLAGWLAETGHRDPSALAEQFLLLIDGATLNALRERSSAPAQRARTIAEALLAALETGTGSSPPTPPTSTPGRA